MAKTTIKGACECGAVRFRLEGELRDVVACHCSQCRRISGHYWAATAVAHKDFTVEDESTLSWYRSSPVAVRGFCRICGSTLFYKHDAKDYLAVSAGCLDTPTSLKLGRHIFVGDKGDYYTLDDTLPCHEGFSHSKPN